MSYDKRPFVQASDNASECSAGWAEIWSRVAQQWRGDGVLAIECYPGVLEQEIIASLRAAFPRAEIIETANCFLPEARIQELLVHELTPDRVFGRITSFTLSDLLEPAKLQGARSRARGGSIVIGTGATLVCPEPALLVYGDMARWEVQRRQRSGLIGSLGMNDAGTSAAALYKRGFFVDWRLADRVKKTLLTQIDFLLDTNEAANPKLISGEAFRGAFAAAVKRPFRVVPFFDPGPWGGQWMRRVCDLPEGPPNYAWCFDCVPEENSLLLGFGSHRVEVPAQNLVLMHSRELLGEAVHGRFGAEFPIRFDFLDTMAGGNLSLQVHPLTEYIQQHFGMNYTQDESYYLLDAEPDACVYLGFQKGVDSAAFARDLRSAQAGKGSFQADQYVNRFPARKHDHFSIPAGTIHCSGRNGMVLEISATPYIFTFKLWDWDRLGLDGHPRPIHIDHGLANLQWDRDTDWVRRELIAQPEAVAAGDGWAEERTGLHKREFIETRRHWFHKPVAHHTGDGVNVLNLVEGDQVTVESPSGSFAPFEVHYAETFIVPAAAGDYRIAPAGRSTQYATVKAFVRTHA